MRVEGSGLRVQGSGGVFVTSGGIFLLAMYGYLAGDGHPGEGAERRVPRARHRPAHVCTSLVRHDGSLGELLDSELYRAVQFSISAQLLSKNVERFRGGLVFKAHRLLYHSTLGSRVITKKKKEKKVEGGVRVFKRARERVVVDLRAEEGARCRV